MKKPGGGLTREQAMAAWPVRNPTIKWLTNDDDCVVVHLPRRKDMVGGVLSFLFSVPESKPVVLDEVGTFVWHLCDGEHSVSEVVDELSREYKLNRREAEVSLTKFLQMLGKRGMVAFAVPRDVAEAAGLAGRQMLVAPEGAEDMADSATSGGNQEPES
jgi:hypothetical protein